MITIKRYQYVRSAPVVCVQGVEQNSALRGSVADGKGSFVKPGEPPKILLFYIEDNTRHCVNLYSFIKQHSTRRITEKYANNICSLLLENKYFPEWKDVQTAIYSKLT